VLFGRQAGQWGKTVGVGVVRPVSMAQSFIAAATVSAMAGSRGSPASIVFMTALKTLLGRRSFMTLALKTSSQTIPGRCFREIPWG